MARAFARMGDDRQAVRWLELALRAGVSPDEVWSEDAFGAYRNDPGCACRNECRSGQAVAHRREFGDRELVSW